MNFELHLKYVIVMIPIVYPISRKVVVKFADLSWPLPLITLFIAISRLTFFGKNHMQANDETKNLVKRLFVSKVKIFIL